MDAKAKFDRRIEDLQKQLKDYQKNNDVIDELKRAHAKELADHIRESNKKYNDLLQEKLNAEDAEVERLKGIAEDKVPETMNLGVENIWLQKLEGDSQIFTKD